MILFNMYTFFALYFYLKYIQIFLTSAGEFLFKFIYVYRFLGSNPSVACYRMTVKMRVLCQIVCSKTDGHSFGEGSCIITTHRVAVVVFSWKGRKREKKSEREREKESDWACEREREIESERVSNVDAWHAIIRYAKRRDKTISLLANDAPRVTERARPLYHETKKKSIS